MRRWLPPVTNHSLSKGDMSCASLMGSVLVISAGPAHLARRRWIAAVSLTPHGGRILRYSGMIFVPIAALIPNPCSSL